MSEVPESGPSAIRYVVWNTMDMNLAQLADHLQEL